ncbi:hypothetical protein AM305_04133, partial [Actinobacillus minor NM305]
KAATELVFCPIKAKKLPFSYSKQSFFNAEWAKKKPVPSGCA